MTLEQVRQLAEALRCDVTADRCADFGCATPGATSLPATWRCPSCAVYWALQQLVMPAFTLDEVREGPRERRDVR